MSQRTHSGENRFSKRILSRVRVHVGPQAEPLLLAAALLLLPGCARHGREVFVREGCGNCHRFRDLGGGGAPNLDGVASRLDAESIRAQITRPGARGTAARMPAFRHLSWYDLQSLVAFFRS